MRVLVVEDEVLLAAEIEFILVEAGFEPVGFALDSREAIDLLERKRPQLALVDVHLLDGPTGIDVARRAVSNYGVPALFMTANRKRIPADFVGACGAIAKPYTQWGMTAALRFVRDGLSAASFAKAPPTSLDLAPDWAARWSAPDGAAA